MAVKTGLAARSAHTKGVIYGVLSALSVSGYVLVNRYVYTKYGVAAFDYAVTFAVAAALFAITSLVSRQVKRHDIKITLRALPSLLLIGFAGGLAMALVVFGQNFTTAVNTGIIMTASIITTNIFSKYMLKQSFSGAQWLWLGMMFVGLYLGIVGLHFLKLNAGDLIVLCAAVALGFSNTFSKVLMRKYDARFIADARLTISGLLMLAAGVVLVGFDVLVTAAGLWPLLGGLFLWLCIRTFYGAVQLLSPNKAIVLNNSQIFFTAIAGVLLLSETYDWVKFAGSAIVLISIYYLSRR